MPIRLCLAVLLALLISRATADEQAAATVRPPMRQPAPGAAPTSKPATNPVEQGDADKFSVTEHQITTPGGPLKYRATAGSMVMKDEAGKAKANLFFVAYEKQPAAEDPSQRPITFVFNGGPGAAAVWLHLGTAGPKRIKLDELGGPPAPPYQLVDNPNTWLNATDLVFIDPVGTGYSRPAAGEKAEQFYGVQEDIQSVGAFIRLYTTRYQRWLSPKFLAGESYGTTRAAGLSQHLLEREGISINGIVFISTVLNFQTLSPSGANDLPYALFLPTYASTAWYHKKLAPDLQADLAKTLKEVEAWSLDGYLKTLAAGAALSKDDRAAAVQKLSRYTGLPAEYVDKSDLRIDPSAFRAELLNDARRVIGRFDARIAGYNPDPVSRSADYDPSFSPYLAAYSAVFNDYVRRTLKYESDVQYEVLSGRVGPWNFGRPGQGYLDVAENLRTAMLGSPHLKVLFASGYFDLATPYLGTKYTVNHIDVGPDLRPNISMSYYDAGHMVYHHRPDQEKLNADIAAFIKRASEPQEVPAK